MSVILNILKKLAMDTILNLFLELNPRIYKPRVSDDLDS